MDGVIIDTRPIMKRAWEFVVKKNKLQKDFSEYIKHVGMPFEEILKQLGIDESHFCIIKEEYGMKTMEYMYSAKPYRGMIRLMNRLTQQGKNVGIVTSKEFWRADYLADSLMINKAILVTPEMTKQGKPSAEPLEFAMKKLKATKHESIYIGDMITDYISAKSAGIDYVHANWGYGEIGQSNMPLIAENSEELYEILVAL